MTDLLIIDNGTRVAFRNRLEDQARYATVTGFTGYSNGVRQYLVEWDAPVSSTERTTTLAEDEFDIVPVTPPSMHDIAQLDNDDCGCTCGWEGRVFDFGQHMRDALS